MAKTKIDEGLCCDWKVSGETLVRFAPDVFGEGQTVLADVLRQVTGAEHPRVLLVADSNVVQRTAGLGTKIGAWVQASGVELARPPVVLGGGEKAKTDNLQSAMRVVVAALEALVGKGDVIVALGGGAVLDVAGWAAAQVRSGIPLVRLPTTVASMVDGAFATTACVDYSGIKDSLCVPSRAAAVVVDPRFADTVLDGVWRGGFGEIARQALVTDGALVKKLAKSVEAIVARDTAVTDELVKAAVESRVKKGATPFALWSALRLEAVSGYKLPHGYAVPIAICLDCDYAVARGVFAAEDRDLVRGLLSASGALDGLSHSQHLLSQPDAILLGLDAWRLSTGSASVVLPAGPGKSVTDESPDRELYKKIAKSLVAPHTDA